MGIQGSDSCRQASWKQSALFTEPTHIRGGPRLSQSRNGPPFLQMSEMRLRGPRWPRARELWGRALIQCPLLWEVPGCFLPHACPGALYLLLGQQQLVREELQALTGEIVAQLLQAIHLQCLGAHGQGGGHPHKAEAWVGMQGQHTGLVPCFPFPQGCCILTRNSGRTGAPRLMLQPTGSSPKALAQCSGCLSPAQPWSGLPVAGHTPALCLSMALSLQASS